MDKTLVYGLKNDIVHGDTILDLGQVGGTGCDILDNFNPIFGDNRKIGHNRSVIDPKMSLKDSNGMGANSDIPAKAGNCDGPKTKFNSSQLNIDTENANSKIDSIVESVKINIKGENEISIAPKIDATLADSSNSPKKHLNQIH